MLGLCSHRSPALLANYLHRIAYGPSQCPQRCLYRRWTSLGSCTSSRMPSSFGQVRPCSFTPSLASQFNLPSTAAELEDMLHFPDDITLDKLDGTLRRYVSFCAAYHGERYRLLRSAFGPSPPPPSFPPYDCGVTLCVLDEQSNISKAHSSLNTHATWSSARSYSPSTRSACVTCW